MIETCKAYVDVLDSVVRCCKKFNASNSVVVFEILIDVYKRKGLLIEAVGIFLEAKNYGFCCWFSFL